MAVKAASHWLLIRQNFASFMISNEYRMNEESMFVGFAVCVRVDKSDVLQWASVYAGVALKRGVTADNNTACSILRLDSLTGPRVHCSSTMLSL